MDEPDRLEIQYESLEKQGHAVRLGVWIFLGSELLLFAGLFGLYAAYRTEYATAFAEGVHHNELWIGTTNTVVLIVSSFTVAWAVHSARLDRMRMVSWMLGLSILLGAAFLTLKGLEYSHHFADGIYPGPAFSYPGLPEGSRLFFTLYYFMTGLHALHMIGGICVMAWLASRARRGRLRAAYHPELEAGALYWHLVDSIWIFLWPLFYLTS